MPCCCKTNVQAAFVLGIIGIVVNLVGCVDITGKFQMKFEMKCIWLIQ